MSERGPDLSARLAGLLSGLERQRGTAPSRSRLSLGFALEPPTPSPASAQGQQQQQRVQDGQQHRNEHGSPEAWAEGCAVDSWLVTESSGPGVLLSWHETVSPLEAATAEAAAAILPDLEEEHQGAPQGDSLGPAEARLALVPQGVRCLRGSGSEWRTLAPQSVPKVESQSWQHKGKEEGEEASLALGAAPIAGLFCRSSAKDGTLPPARTPRLVHLRLRSTSSLSAAVRPLPRGEMLLLLQACARAIDSGDRALARERERDIRAVSSPSGTALQRLAYAVLRALKVRAALQPRVAALKPSPQAAPAVLSQLIDAASPKPCPASLRMARAYHTVVPIIPVLASAALSATLDHAAQGAVRCPVHLLLLGPHALDGFDARAEALLQGLAFLPQGPPPSVKISVVDLGFAATPESRAQDLRMVGALGRDLRKQARGLGLPSFGFAHHPLSPETLASLASVRGREGPFARAPGENETQAPPRSPGGGYVVPEGVGHPGDSVPETELGPWRESVPGLCGDLGSRMGTGLKEVGDPRVRQSGAQRVPEGLSPSPPPASPEWGRVGWAGDSAAAASGARELVYVWDLLHLHHVPGSVQAGGVSPRGEVLKWVRSLEPDLVVLGESDLALDSPSVVSRVQGCVDHFLPCLEVHDHYLAACARGPRPGAAGGGGGEGGAWEKKRKGFTDAAPGRKEEDSEFSVREMYLFEECFLGRFINYCVSAMGVQLVHSLAQEQWRHVMEVAGFEEVAVPSSTCTMVAQFLESLPLSLRMRVEGGTLSIANARGQCTMFAGLWRPH